MLLSIDFTVDFKNEKNIQIDGVITEDFNDFNEGLIMRVENQKAVTVRFPMRDYLALTSEAEAKNTTTAEVVRQAWASHQEHQNLVLLFAKLEQRLLAKTFEICAATVGLSDSERKLAARQINTALGKEIVR
ncbi:hypothetical protein KAM461_15180 [Aeromonas hydrophila]|nr:hypothetical protein KAM461_15180 [Aeromonas hydrophila]